LGISSCLYESDDLFDVFSEALESEECIKGFSSKTYFSQPLEGDIFHKSFFPEHRKASSISISIKNRFQHACGSE
jgi:hypothetical protein